jgi:hypothetical protein
MNINLKIPCFVSATCFLMFCSSPGDALANTIKFEIEQVSGKSPFLVKIKGPSLLLSHGTRKHGKWVACGYWIEWGDGPYSYSPSGTPPDCSKGFEHSYDKPGSYAVKATVFHPGHADETIVDWSETINVVVR